MSAASMLPLDQPHPFSSLDPHRHYQAVMAVSPTPPAILHIPPHQYVYTAQYGDAQHHYVPPQPDYSQYDVQAYPYSVEPFDQYPQLDVYTPVDDLPSPVHYDPRVEGETVQTTPSELALAHQFFSEEPQSPARLQYPTTPSEQGNDHREANNVQVADIIHSDGTFHYQSVQRQVSNAIDNQALNYTEQQHFHQTSFPVKEEELSPIPPELVVPSQQHLVPLTQQFRRVHADEALPPRVVPSHGAASGSRYTEQHARNQQQHPAEQHAHPHHRVHYSPRAHPHENYYPAEAPMHGLYPDEPHAHAHAHGTYYHSEPKHKHEHDHNHSKSTHAPSPPLTPPALVPAYHHGGPYFPQQALFHSHKLSSAYIPPPPSARQSTSALRGKSPHRERPQDKKPVMACLFCRGRKIACGAAPPGSKDRTCNQCARRHLKCVYPKVSRRGFRKRTIMGPNGSVDTLKVKPLLTSTKRSPTVGRTKPGESLLAPAPDDESAATPTASTSGSIKSEYLDDPPASLSQSTSSLSPHNAQTI